MTPEQMREQARRNVADWPPLTQAQRLQLAVTLRPDLPEPGRRPDEPERPAA